MIRGELHALAPLEKDETLELTLAEGAFESLITDVQAKMRTKFGLSIPRSEIAKHWSKLADDLGIKKKTRRTSRNPSKST